VERLSPRFDALYVHFGRPSVAPEKLLRALLLQALYTIRSERGPVRRVFGRGTRTRRRSGGSNPTVDFHGQRRTNATHHSTTDPDARLYKKARGREARLGYLGHVLLEHRSGLTVDTRVTPADGHGERDAALLMIQEIPGQHRITVAADKGYDTRDFVTNLRVMDVTPHVAQYAASRVRCESTQTQTRRANVWLDEDGRRAPETAPSRWPARLVGLYVYGRGVQHRPVATPVAGERMLTTPTPVAGRAPAVLAARSSASQRLRGPCTLMNATIFSDLLE